MPILARRRSLGTTAAIFDNTRVAEKSYKKDSGLDCFASFTSILDDDASDDEALHDRRDSNADDNNLVVTAAKSADRRHTISKNTTASHSDLAFAEENVLTKIDI